MFEKKLEEDNSKTSVECLYREKDNSDIIKTLKEIEILESITSYDNILKKKDNTFKENLTYEDIVNVEKQIKESVFNFDLPNNILANYAKSKL